MKKITLLIIIITNLILCYSQNKLIDYYNKYNEVLIADTSKYKEIKLYEDKYKNGRIKQKSFLVILKSDTSNKYWHIGKCMTFHRNGRLRSVHFNNSNFLSADSSYYFNRKGQLEYVQIIRNIKDYNSLPFIDTSFVSYNPKISLEYLYVDTLDLTSVQESKKGFGAYNLNISNKNKQVIYKKSKKYLEGYYLREPNNDKFKTIYTYIYNSDGAIEFRIPDEKQSRFQISSNKFPWDSIEFNNNNSKEINEAVLNFTKGKRGLIPNKLFFDSGYYLLNGDTSKCLIFSTIDEILNQDLNTFILIKTDKYKVLTAKDISSFGFGNKKYIRLGIGEQFIFIEELTKGKVTLYQSMRTPTNQGLTYYLTLNDSENMFVFKSGSDNLPREGQVGSAIMDYQSQTIKTFSFQKDIIKFIFSFPNLNDNIKNRIKSGFWNENDIEMIIEEYNKNTEANSRS